MMFLFSIGRVPSPSALNESSELFPAGETAKTLASSSAGLSGKSHRLCVEIARVQSIQRCSSNDRSIKGRFR
jgi:hypothetical protein